MQTIKHLTDEQLWIGAMNVLRNNDLGGWTKASPALYPHQWSWDSAFIAIGLSRVDPSRALKELETLFSAQWADGRVPHIVFNPKAHDYFPGPDRWDCAALNPDASKTPATSGIIQPPVHALAVWKIFLEDHFAKDELVPRIKALFPKLLAWHRYLATQRDPEKLGLISIYHPWESGTDNSPRWDLPMSKVKVGKVPPYTRRDTTHVKDASQRPTQQEYDKYLWLVECLKKAHYKDEEILQQKYPFIIKDTFMSAIFALANDSLIKLAERIDEPKETIAEITQWKERTTQGIVEKCWDSTTNLALDLDVKHGLTPISVSTCAGLAPIVVPGMQRAIVEQSVAKLTGPDFAGHAGLAYPVLISTTPDSPGFKPRAYWRGPSWPVVNWLFYECLRMQGFNKEGTDLRQYNLAMLRRPDSRFAEYFEPFTAEPLGSLDQAWTAAVVIDWLSAAGAVKGTKYME